MFELKEGSMKVKVRNLPYTDKMLGNTSSDIGSTSRVLYEGMNETGVGLLVSE